MEERRTPAGSDAATPSTFPSAGELAEAFEALTLLRLRRRRGPASPGRAALFYPLVGLALGGALAGIDRVAVGLAGSLRSALLVAALAALSRGGPLRGFARTCRAVSAGADRERALERLRGSSSEVIGWLAGTVLLGLRPGGYWRCHTIASTGSSSRPC